MSNSFNTSGNNQTYGRTTAAVNLGKLRNTLASTSRKFKFCNRNSPDLNFTFNCVFNRNTNLPNPEPPTPLDPDNGNIQTIVTSEGIVYLSTNYGKTWKRITELKNYELYGIAISYDGIYQTTSNVSNFDYHGALISNNAGNNWTFSSTQPIRFDFDAGGICMSSSGQYQFSVDRDISLAEPTLIYISSDYGNSWAEPTNPPLGFIPPLYTTTYKISIRSISCSTNGQYSVAIALDKYNTGIGILYLNSDYGQYWGSAQALTNTNLIYAGISGDGNVISLGYSNAGVKGNVSIQTSVGGFEHISWYSGSITNGPNGDWGIFGIALSHTGQYQIASNCSSNGAGSNANGYIYITTDSGHNWHYISTINGVPTINMQWNYVAISPSGKTMVAVGYYNDFHSPIPNTSNWYVYSNDYGVTWNSKYFGRSDILNSIAIN